MSTNLVFFYFWTYPHPLIENQPICGMLSGPPENDRLTPVRESTLCPKRDGKRVQERHVVKTGWSTRIGRTGKDPSLQTWPEPGNERDPCRMRETDAPALRNESLGRYEASSKEFYLDTLFSKRRMEKLEHVDPEVWMWVSFVWMLKWDMHIRRGGWWKLGLNKQLQVCWSGKPAFKKNSELWRYSDLEKYIFYATLMLCTVNFDSG